MFMTRPEYQGPIGKVKKMRPTGSGVQGAVAQGRVGGGDDGKQLGHRPGGSKGHQ